MIFYTIKKIIFTLFIYNIFSLVVYYSNNLIIFESVFQSTPYNYSILFNHSEYRNPNNLNNYQKKMILNILEDASFSSRLDPDYWNYQLNANYQMNKKKDYNFLYNTLYLTKNHSEANFYLKNIFIKNYSYFNEEEKKKIIELFHP